MAPATSSSSAEILRIENLKTWFVSDSKTVKAVDDLSLTVRAGETLGLVGESGSGKSVTSLSIMRLLPDVGTRHAGGTISFLGKDLVKLPKRELYSLRGSALSMIFQEPGTSLNPVYRVGDQVCEAILLHEPITKAEARQRAIKLFEEVGIPNPQERIDSYPHEMSGGQKQRVMIAMALACNPKLLIADEPTTALDVTIQAQILELLRKLRDERDMAMIFITHDLGVIAEIADHVAVMYRGKLVEVGPVEEVYGNPKHPYTKGLLACRPQLHAGRKRLPTVADFMDVTLDPQTGDPIITERTLSNTELAQIEQSGRGRLYSPQPEIERAGFSIQALSSIEGSQFLPVELQPVLKVTDLKVYYPIKRGLLRRTVGYVKAVDGINLTVYPGQTLGLVGESGCGKTTAGRAILRLIRTTSGQIQFEGEDWLGLGASQLRARRKRMQIVFQDPYASLNPRLTVEAMLTEAMAVHRLGTSAADRRDRAATLLEEVGLLTEHLGRYPHEFSGGQRQRICIARALSVEPSFLICDESVSALDVSVQAQVLNLLKEMQLKRQLTYIFISHDLGVVKFMSDMMAVMNAGKIVEWGPSDAIYANPQNDYTKRLISAIPNPSLDRIRQRVAARRR